MSANKKLKISDNPSTQLDPNRKLRSIVYQAANFAEEKKAIDTEVLDVTKLADISDYVIICSGNNPAQLKAIARHIEESLTDLGMEPTHKEGRYGDKWFLLDYIDFVVHVIDEDARSFYNLEELWSGAIFVPQDEWLES